MERREFLGVAAAALVPIVPTGRAVGKSTSLANRYTPGAIVPIGGTTRQVGKTSFNRYTSPLSLHPPSISGLAPNQSYVEKGKFVFESPVAFLTHAFEISLDAKTRATLEASLKQEGNKTSIGACLSDTLPIKLNGIAARVRPDDPCPYVDADGDTRVRDLAAALQKAHVPHRLKRIKQEDKEPEELGRVQLETRGRLFLRDAEAVAGLLTLIESSRWAYRDWMVDENNLRLVLVGDRYDYPCLTLLGLCQKSQNVVCRTFVGPGDDTGTTWYGDLRPVWNRFV